MTEFTKRPDGLMYRPHQTGAASSQAPQRSARRRIGSSIGLGEARAQEPKRGGTEAGLEAERRPIRSIRQPIAVRYLS